ncbi:MAG TPA: hypothetical protein DG761_09830 [Gammaproteobacteria bacterium]|mgnify:CR=1 FL=1|jgi:phosphatidylglycerol:prolipoprotein diacylglycerol transferase|nr:hypothetical protein [Acidiferrobacteraceae bacterium]HCX88312.1 hypothetical protein [Gammaproteobacteria bacterium]
MLGIGLLTAWWFSRRRAVVECIDPSHIDLAVPLTFLISILGVWLLSKINLGEMLIDNQPLQQQNRFRLFSLLFIALPTLFIYCRASGLGYRRMLDLFALPALLWLVCVRVGCFLTGCCWGDIAVRLEAVVFPFAAQVQTLPWLIGDWVWSSVSFPRGSLVYQQHIALGLIGDSATESLPIHPTQLYELVYVLILWTILQATKFRLLPAGCLAVATLAGYVMGRFVIEFLRADSELIVANLTFAQLLCTILLVCCIFGYRRFSGRAAY